MFLRRDREQSTKGQLRQRSAKSKRKSEDTRTESPPQEARMRPGRISLYRFQRGHEISLQTTSLQNQETINCCWLSHPVCGSLSQKQVLIQRDLQESAFFLKRGFLASTVILKRTRNARKLQKSVPCTLLGDPIYSCDFNLNLKGTVSHICTTIQTSLELQNVMLKSPLTHPILNGGHT